MDTRLLDVLRNAPSLDLYELSLAIDQMLTDPRRILEVRRHTARLPRQRLRRNGPAGAAALAAG